MWSRIFLSFLAGWFAMFCLAAGPQKTAGFVVSNTRCTQIPWKRLKRKTTMVYSTTVSTANSTIEANQRGSGTHREIMSFLISRCDKENASSSSWTKTRNYIYHANGDLSTCQVKEVVHFLEALFPNDPKLVRTILQSTPRILRKNVKCLLQPTADFLLELYGPDLFQVAMERNPSLLLASGVGYQGENEQLESFLMNELELSKSTVAKLKQTSLFQMQTEKVQTVMNFLETILQKGDFSATKSQRIIGKLLVSHTYLMNLCVETNLKPRIRFLTERCNLKERDIAVLVKSSPGILGLSVDHNLRPTIEYLAGIINSGAGRRTRYSDEEKALLRKCLLGHSQLLALSLKNLQSKVDYFNAIDGMDKSILPDSSLAARIATRAPAVFSLSLKENVIPTVEFLAQVWGTPAPNVQWQADGEIDILLHQPVRDKEGSSVTESLAKRLKEYPGVLTLSLEGNIQPTISFFNRTGYIFLDDHFRERENGNGKPHKISGRYIAASLYSRLLPRWHHTVSNEWIGSKEAASKLPPLHVLVGATDKAFCKQMGFDLKEYLYFKEENAPRLKFSSQFDTWLKTGRPIDVS